MFIHEQCTYIAIKVGTQFPPKKTEKNRISNRRTSNQLQNSFHFFLLSSGYLYRYHSSTDRQATFQSNITGSDLFTKPLMRQNFIEERMTERLTQRYPLRRFIIQHLVNQIEQLSVLQVIILFIPLKNYKRNK